MPCPLGYQRNSEISLCNIIVSDCNNEFYFHPSWARSVLDSAREKTCACSTKMKLRNKPVSEYVGMTN